MVRAVTINVVLACSVSWAQTVSVSSLLAELTDRDAIAKWPSPGFTCSQSSSYDRASKSPADGESWFANDDKGQFIRVEKHSGRLESVLMDADGPGAIVRIWSANPIGTIRVYVDNEDKPVIEAPAAYLLRGGATVGGVLLGPPMSEMRGRGCSLYLPIPYAKHCKVTCEDPKGLYYHVEFRTYVQGTPVESFSPAAMEAAAEAFNRAQATLRESRDRVPNWFSPFRLEVPAGGTVRHELRSGPTCVSSVAVSLGKGLPLGRLEPKQLADALRRAVIVMEFDGERTVWCPLSDFFGSGMGVNEFKDWWRSATPGDRMESRWLMPYERAAALSIVNLSDSPLEIDLDIAGGHWEWNDRSMHFGAAWRQETFPTRPMRDWIVAKLSGQGVYVGDSLTVVNPVADWWGEGDEKFYVDGETFPSHFGTGTEDYFGYAWSSTQIFSGPWHEQGRCDGPGSRGISCVGRVRLLDGIPFSKSLRFDLEAWHWRDVEVTFGAASFFYIRPGATIGVPPSAEQARRGAIEVPPPPPPFAIAGAIECEKMTAATSPGVEAVHQDMATFGLGHWSGEGQLWVKAKKAGDFVDLQIPAPGSEPVHVLIHATRSWDYALVKFTLNGATEGKDVDLCEASSTADPVGPIDLGLATPVNGRIVLRATALQPGRGAKEPGYYFGLDCVELK